MVSHLLKKQSLWLIVPPLLLCLADAAITLTGQPAAYWAGDYSAYNEISPSFGYYLSVHPLLFVAAIILWISIFSLVILLLPEFLALVASATVLLGHMLGVSTWLMYRFGSYQAAMALVLITAVLLVLAFKKGQNADGSAALHWEQSGLPNGLRWGLIGVLVSVPVWWFLIPRA